MDLDRLGFEVMPVLFPAGDEYLSELEKYRAEAARKRAAGVRQEARREGKALFVGRARPPPFFTDSEPSLVSVFSPPLDGGSADVAWTRLVEVSGFSESSFKAPTESTAAELVANKHKQSHTRNLRMGDKRIHMDEYL